MTRSTDTKSAPWRAEVIAGVLVWVIFTAVVIAVAPLVVALPLPVTAAVVIHACVVIGWVIGRSFARVRPRPQAGVRVGVAVVIVGQLLDVLLVVLLGGYPRAGEAGSVVILTLLLGGYPAALLGATAADRWPRVGRAGR